MSDLINEFINEEFNDYIEGLLKNLFESQNKTNEKFEFNRFELEINFDLKTVKIFDVLDGSENGVLEVELSKFKNRVLNS